jgi:hypothetical protein
VPQAQRPFRAKVRAAFCLSGPAVARTLVYIDGFNLYYRALRGTPHKWLDIEAMSRAVLPSTCMIERINYSTAHISGRVDAGAPRRQHAYLRAIATLPRVVKSAMLSGQAGPHAGRPIVAKVGKCPFWTSKNSQRRVPVHQLVRISKDSFANWENGSV